MKKWFMSLVMSLLLSAAPLYAQQNDATTSGSLTAPAQAVQLELNAYGTTAVQVTGTWTGTLQFEATVDLTGCAGSPCWFSVQALQVSTQTAVTSTTANDAFLLATAAFARVRVRSSALASGTAVVSLQASAPTSYPAAVAGGAASNVTVVNAAPIDVNCASGCGSSGFLDNATFTVGAEALSNIGGVRLDAPADVANGDAAVARITKQRGLHVSLRSDDGVEALQQTGAGLSGNEPLLPIGFQLDGAPFTWSPGSLNSLGELGVAVSALPLPAGAATAALQTQPGVDIGDVTVNNAAGAAAVNIQDGGNSITVDATTLPLPTGASTETTLAAMNTKVPSQIDSRVPVTTGINVLDPISVGTDPMFPIVGLNTSAAWAPIEASDTTPNSDDVGLITRNIPSGTQAVSVSSLPLPSGAATSAKQDTEIASLASIDTKTPALVSGRQPVDGSGVTQPISAASLPLPTGAATSANQTNGTQQSKITNGSLTAEVMNTDPTGSEAGLVVRVGGVLPEVFGDFRLINGSNIADISAAGALKVDGSAVTQPVSGVVDVEQASDWIVHVQDGVGNPIASATTAPAGTERGLIVRQAGDVTVNGAVTVDGSVEVLVGGGALATATATPSSSATGLVTRPLSRSQPRASDVRTSFGDFNFVINPLADGLSTLVVEWKPAACVDCEMNAQAVNSDGSRVVLQGVNAATGVILGLGATPLGDYVFDVAGYTSVKVVMEEYTSGSATAWAQVSDQQTGLTPLLAKIATSIRIDQTTPGTTNGVRVNAGTAIIGKVGIDQTTPGTTNGVQVNAALPAGTNNIGDVDVLTLPGVTGAAASGAAKSGNPVQTGAVFNTTQPTVTTGQVVENQATARGAQIVATGVDTFNVTVNTALPAGTNAIGKLAANSGVDIGALTANQSVNVTQFSGTAAVSGSGTATGALRVELANNGTGLVGLNAGTNGIGKLTANSGVDIGDVDVTSVTSAFANAKVDASGSTVKIDQTTTANDVDVVSAIPGTGATNLGKAEDAAHVTADTGVAIWGVRNDNAATTFGADNDYTPIAVDAHGAVFTRPDVARLASISGQESVAAPLADTWYIRKQWALPSGAIYTPSHAWAAVTTALTKTVFVVANNLGNLNTGTNTFTAANSVASPQFYGRLFGCVTTVLSATIDVVTPTYTDELGNSQAVPAGASFAASTPVGSCQEFALATGSPASALDVGVRAVTAATDSAATTGVITFYGVNVLADFAGTAASQTETQQFPPATSLEPNEQIIVLMRQAATTAQLKTYGISGTLR